MGECIGLDFGTTYSTIAYLTGIKKNGEKVSYDQIKVATMQDGALGDQYDSLIVKTRTRTRIGISARNHVGDSDAVVYKGFKVLLSDEKATAQRAEYSQNFTPSDATELFITDILNTYSERYPGGIDKLVVGVPEIWFDEKWKDRDILQKIISSVKKRQSLTPLVQDVQLISEPACACAYFIDNYKKNTGQNFVGKMLLIDYGGGTLDITWCNVETTKDGNSEVSVPPGGRFGAGANSERCLGKAGLLFLEASVRKAIEVSGVSKDEIVTNASFYECMHKLEKILITEETEIRDTFELGIDNIRDEEVTTFTYKTGEISRDCQITYGILSDAFNENIKPVLTDILQQAIDFFNTGKRPEDMLASYSEKDNLKIAMIGGFCSFVLTEKTIKGFNVIAEGGSGKDKRYKDIDSNFNNTGITPSMSRKNAVAYGAALLANGVVKYKSLVPFTLKAVVVNDDGSEKVLTLMEAGREFEYGVPIKWTQNVAGSFMDPKEKDPDRKNYLLKEINHTGFKSQPKLPIPSAEKDHVYKMAISLDKSSIISFHIRDYGTPATIDWETPKSERKIPLADIYTIMGLSDAYEI